MRKIARIALLGGLLCAATQAIAEPQHAIAMRGKPALPPDFSAFPYVNSAAPKGGSATYAVPNTFDSINPFIINGAPSPGTSQLVFETLMARSADEPFTFYPLIAKTVETPPDRSWVEFTLDERARFSDGVPVTADDVAFSLGLLQTKGRARLNRAYDMVDRVEIRGPHLIRFTFKPGNNRELPLIIANMTVLPRHAVDVENFEMTTLKPMIGSGPYVFGQIKPGASVTFHKNPDWWGKNLPSNRGLYNFDTITYEFYRDSQAMFESFKIHQYDVRSEGEASRWASEYDFSAIRDGRVTRQEIANGLPKPANSFVFNTRRPLFADIYVRQALAMLFDFEWVNPNIYRGLYRRNCGYFDDSVLSSCGQPANEKERALLAPFPDSVRPDVMNGTWHPPVSDRSGHDRTAARQALALLKQAGWNIRNGRMEKNGRQLQFEILLSGKTYERVALFYADSARQLGIDVKVHFVDDAQYQRRRQTYDFDVMQTVWQASLSPGNEQFSRWSSGSANTPGSFNFAGVHNRAADAMIEAMLAADNQEDFIAAVRALDRVLISGSYVIPLFYAPKMWIARWNNTTRPEKPAIAFGAYGDTLALDPIIAHASTP